MSSRHFVGGFVASLITLFAAAGAVGCSDRTADTEETGADDLTQSAEPALEESFGEGGRLVIDGGATDLLPLSTGDVVVANRGALRIVTAQGVVKDGPAVDGLGKVLARQESPGGKLLYLFDGGTLMRFSANATVDTTFGTAGRVTAPSLPSPVAGASFHPSSFAIDAAGGILLGGHQTGAGATYLGPAIVRLDGAGNVDATFGESGFVRPSTKLPELAKYARVSSIHVRANGEILATVERQDENADSPTGRGFFLEPAAVVAFGPNGSAIDTFGEGGIAFLERPGIANHEGELHRARFVVGSNGDLLVRGESFGGNGVDGLARIAPSTGLDPAFAGAAGGLILQSRSWNGQLRASNEQALLLKWPSGAGAVVSDYTSTPRTTRADEGLCSVTVFRQAAAPQLSSWIVRRPGFDGFCNSGVAALAPNGSLIVATNYVNHGSFPAGVQLTVYKK